jgi:hypothetical protein
VSTSELPATSDFYALERVLGDDDRAYLASVRAFMREEVAPIINDFWAREEFPHDVVWPRVAELGLGGIAIQGYGCAGRGIVVDGFVAMELAAVDCSVATGLGVHNHLAMGAIVHCGSEEQEERWLPRMAAFEAIGEDERKIALRAVQSADITLTGVVVPETLRRQKRELVRGHRRRAHPVAGRPSPAWRCGSPASPRPGRRGSSTRCWPRRSAPPACARPPGGRASCWRATASRSSTTGLASSPTRKRSTPTRARAKINSLIVGLAITGQSAFAGK